ncbi:GNAT family N-acetyltransferase [Lutibacter sp. B1]|uniref:GNAT family N-acetyltransferase n=1 Tax=Lutibacter sp. B1 TaxID=2725996 RepID=UPI001456CC2E|nr:GNAT family N-acetyltransferase [Lutibacter sp. B1]NLP57949.1 GNAT family N-acetyltransferase [Lutibacter sp. B1]
MIKIKQISAEETYPIRLEVLRKNILLPYVFNGDTDNDTFHIGAFEDDKLIAVSSYMKVSNSNFKGNQYQLRGMATLTEYQGLGAGKLMLHKVFSILKTKNIDILWCNARVAALNFYKKQGFVVFGDKFDVPQIGDHYVMYVKL